METDTLLRSGTILAISGSLERGSINSAALRAAAAAAARDCTVVAIDESVRQLQHFNPDLDTTPPAAVLAFRGACERAAGVLVCVPEYAFGIPGAFKNALDWTVGSSSLHRKPITLLNVAPPGRGEHVREALDLVLRALDADVAHCSVPVAPSDRDAHGEVSDPRIITELRAVVAELANRASKSLDPAEPASPVRVEHHAGSRADLRSLFELAEDSPTQLASYLDCGRVLVAVQGEQILGHLQLTETDLASEAEIKSMAVLASHRRRGIGRKLIATAIQLARAESRHTVRVATAAADLDNLRFYQHLGFRMRSIERDAFTLATGYEPATSFDGIELRDRVWLDLPLDDATRPAT